MNPSSSVGRDSPEKQVVRFLILGLALLLTAFAVTKLIDTAVITGYISHVGSVAGQIVVWLMVGIAIGILGLHAFKSVRVDENKGDLLRQQIEKEKTRIDQQFQSLLDSHIDGICVVRDGEILYANHRLCKICACPSAQGLDTCEFIQQLALGEQEEGCGVDVEADVESDFEPKKTVLTITGKSGALKHVEVAAREIVYQDSNCQMYFVCDVTKRRNLQRRLEDLSLKMVDVGRASLMSEMASGIAHEINQPLTAIANSAGACSAQLSADSNFSTDRLRDTLDLIENQACRAGGIIRQLRQILRKPSMPYEELCFGEVLRDVVELVSAEADIRKIEIETDVPETQVLISADRLQVHQLLTQLLRNACDATSRQSQRRLVKLTMRVRAKEVLLEVYDNGPGLQNSSHDEIFEPFYSTKPNGVGMGLTICRSVLQNHSGQLWFESEEGSGTTAFVTLPMVSDSSINPTFTDREQRQLT